MTTRKAAQRVVFICLKAALFVLIFLGLIYVGQRAFRYSHAIFSDKAIERAPGRDLQLELDEDISAKKLAGFLEKKGVIQNAEEFRIQIRHYGYRGDIKAGSYVINTSMKPSEIIRILFGDTGEDT